MQGKLQSQPFLCGLLFDDECHEDKVHALGSIGNAVLFTIWTKSGCTSCKADLFAVIVIECFALQDMIGFCIAVMCMDADGTSRWNRDLREHIAFAIQFVFAEYFFNLDRALAAGFVLCLDCVAF